MEIRLTPLVAAALVLLAVPEASGQSLRIGIIDFYGLRQLSQTQARAALAVKEGDTVLIAADARPAFMLESEHRLSILPGVLTAHLNLVCCDAGSWIIYVGIEEKGSPITHFREAPRGRVRLAADVVQTGKEFSRAYMAAVQRGAATEDDSQGHALIHDPTTRAIQERFIEYARDLTQLRDVLRHSSDAEHRALAAQILGYAANKRDVIEDLVYGMNDPSEAVRNNAMRALAVIARGASGSRPTLRIPFEPFIDLINSPVWTDRNKASFALMELTESRDPELLAKLRSRAIVSLVEMARWKSEGHAMPAFMILGRIGGRSDEDIQTAWTRGEREAIIHAALERR
jgi:hypothetical protein